MSKLRFFVAALVFVLIAGLVFLSRKQPPPKTEAPIGPPILEQVSQVDNPVQRPIPTPILPKPHVDPEILNLPWTGKLSLAQMKQYATRGQREITVIHPAFTLKLPKKWRTSVVKTQLDYFDEWISFGFEAVFNVFINYQVEGVQRLAGDRNVQTMNDTVFGGKKVKMFRDGRMNTGVWYFYSAEKYEVAVLIDIRTRLSAERKAELKVLTDSFRLN